MERKQSLIGTVVSTKCSKSISVRVEHRKLNKKYNVYYSVHRKIMAHDEEEKAKMGDIVRIVPCRPMSRKKRHKLMDIIRRPKYANIDLGEFTPGESAQGDKSDSAIA
jgi:small subunit ribosomal protein S17